MFKQYWGILASYLFFRKLQKEKMDGLQKVECDIEFLETCKDAKNAGSFINILRNDLKNERAKGEKADKVALTEIAYKIAEKEKLQQGYGNLLKAKDDLEEYIKLIKQWKKLLWDAKLS